MIIALNHLKFLVTWLTANLSLWSLFGNISFHIAAKSPGGSAIYFWTTVLLYRTQLPIKYLLNSFLARSSWVHGKRCLLSALELTPPCHYGMRFKKWTPSLTCSCFIVDTSNMKVHILENYPFPVSQLSAHVIILQNNQLIFARRAIHLGSECGPECVIL